MLYDAKNGNIRIGNTDMDYISFGRGERNLVMMPGLGDGLKTVKGLSSTFAVMYRKYAKDFKVYVFSRKNQMEYGYSTRDMARDQKTAMDQLGISRAFVLGISQGGMIAQHIAIDYPDLVERLVLAVSIAEQNETLQTTIKSWIQMADNNDYRSIFIDSAEKSYTEKRLKKYRPFYPILSRIGKPKDLSRFIIQANACIKHDAYDDLSKIECPTLIIGADSDKIVGGSSSEELVAKINGCELFIFKGFGHGVYEETEDFNSKVMEFFGRV